VQISTIIGRQFIGYARHCAIYGMILVFSDDRRRFRTCQPHNNWQLFWTSCD